jgi:hypothetical protein
MEDFGNPLFPEKKKPPQNGVVKFVPLSEGKPIIQEDFCRSVPKCKTLECRKR